jgi:hypothetical protein
MKNKLKKYKWITASIIFLTILGNIVQAQSYDAFPAERFKVILKNGEDIYDLQQKAGTFEASITQTIVDEEGIPIHSQNLTLEEIEFFDNSLLLQVPIVTNKWADRVLLMRISKAVCDYYDNDYYLIVKNEQVYSLPLLENIYMDGSEILNEYRFRESESKQLRIDHVKIDKPFDEEAREEIIESYIWNGTQLSKL